MEYVLAVFLAALVGCLFYAIKTEKALKIEVRHIYKQEYDEKPIDPETKQKNDAYEALKEDVMQFINEEALGVDYDDRQETDRTTAG